MQTNNVIQFPSKYEADINSFEAYLEANCYDFEDDYCKETMYIDEWDLQKKVDVLKDTVMQMSYYLNEIELWRK